MTSREGLRDTSRALIRYMSCHVCGGPAGRQAGRRSQDHSRSVPSWGGLSSSLGALSWHSQQQPRGPCSMCGRVCVSVCLCVRLSDICGHSTRFYYLQAGQASSLPSLLRRCIFKAAAQQTQSSRFGPTQNIPQKAFCRGSAVG